MPSEKGNTMPTDPLDSLRLPDDPIHPTPEFAATLRTRIERALGRTPTPTQGATMPQTVTAYLSCRGAADALAFYIDVFGAVEVGQRYVDQADGRLGHAEFDINGSHMMIADEYPEVGSVSPLTLGGTPISFSVLVDTAADVDGVYERAVAAGATGQRPPEDQPYGMRAAWVLDQWGHRWTVQAPLGKPAESFPGFDLIDAPGATADAAYAMPARARALLDGPTQLGYFTMFTPDVERASTFFTALFGWQIEPGGHIANIDPPGGLAVRPGVATESPVTLYFQVPDMDAMCARVLELGGQVTLRTTYESGDNAECTDDQGLRFDLHKPIPGYERQ
jgi:uncharacterized glyoxalase superfamily protein PhnB